MADSIIYDVTIIGGSYAGLSAAMTLGRSLKKTLVIDSGKPCNAQTPHSHNFMTQDGNTPKGISMLAKNQVENYGAVRFQNDLAVSGKKTGYGFEIKTKSKKTFRSKKLIFATGVRDIMPNIKGFSECWGISVIHCPYCHGYEHRNQKTAILANGDTATHMVPLVHNLTKDLTILTSGKAEFIDEQRTKFEQHNIPIVESKIGEIDHQNGHVKNVVFQDHTKMGFDTVYARPPFEQHSNIPSFLGCELNEQGYIVVDDFQKTTVEGVFACGDNTTAFRSVANAVYKGNVAGAKVNMELTQEVF
ncbi:NAD(P)/FAD-dependent oxidoreductase [Ulvibacterium marinum]|uniref:NAD(P)/FAD-dependent oxidoreductase n=1 Tax=Ulvibacterium marinum TaxID=2419782 RepID=A0A3B0CAY1_9FLAO|nr:NAD(P)/FAD-dependent oxidoreductase [Ulvibacterium marinum]RKN80026.1 NAD(P)/FAD-dependent oxidoreductase [Ulvibacterium marinum]